MSELAGTSQKKKTKILELKGGRPGRASPRNWPFLARLRARAQVAQTLKQVQAPGPPRSGLGAQRGVARASLNPARQDSQLRLLCGSIRSLQGCDKAQRCGQWTPARDPGSGRGPLATPPLLSPPRPAGLAFPAGSAKNLLPCTLLATL